MNANPHAALSVKQRRYLAALAECGTITGAARASGVDHKSHYRWLRNHAEYRAAYEEARDLAGDLLEGEARRRAIEGVQTPIYHHGTVVGHRVSYSDRLLMLLLRGNLPEKYGARQTTTTRPAATGAVQIIDAESWGRAACPE